MRYVIALGGNALLRRAEPPDAAVQRRHVRRAAAQLAPVVGGHEVVLCHGNGPQIGLLAIESASDPALRSSFPLDTLGAQTQGMIGYWLAQELRNAGVTKPVVSVLTQTVVDGGDPAFTSPTKFIGPVYSRLQADRFARRSRWRLRADGGGWRRVVASPQPRSVVELGTIRQLVDAGTVVICAGGGGAPVVADTGALHGVEAVVDKDLTAALVAIELGADRLVLLTDVDAVKARFGTPAEHSLRALQVADIDAATFPAGSMGPKIEACVRFANATGRVAVIGALDQAAEVAAGRAGTRVGLDVVAAAGARP